MESDAVWKLYLESRQRADVPDHVRRVIGGAAKRLFPSRYRRLHERDYEVDHPEAKARRLARIAKYQREHPRSPDLGYLAAWRARNPDYWRDYYRRHAEQERERSRRRYWAAREGQPQRERPPRLSPEERRERNRAAVLKYRETHRAEIAARERARRAANRIADGLVP